ncbi:alpha/beta fold hydrolase [Glaciimonas immobilis]|uniref:Pimeloyl-ACP methyl ester carboxylesterase n=1 Tax=Glaciimonas immobilis TaxID=728004 RepID=A0A840RTL5_9BURK|nr:alpha/beta hydrolase [Glaciimonas immobilis]KAF3998272.1 alpha/beta hydrolase [Glaciimonas immobilis]MBB5201887.1 pimeloyl-ACP methyl ester carboxylesterase [Glaciimonas immobilis]
MKPSQSDFIHVRGLRYHIRRWGSPDAPLLVMLHGWMDVSASFQFVVDELAQDWQIIAPDWRGFGLTQRSPAEVYWFPDYLADLDVILQHYAEDKRVNLLGHSMGGYVAGLYAGIRPERIRKLVNLEGFGPPVTQPEQAPGRYTKWLNELRLAPVMHAYPTQAAVANRLKKNNPRLTSERANFLVQYWASESSPECWEVLGDPAHKRVNPVLPKVEEMLACWRQITAPVLCVEASETNIWQWMGSIEAMRSEIDRRVANIKDARLVTIASAGHMLHHDQPRLLARTIEDFLSEHLAA